MKIALAPAILIAALGVALAGCPNSKLNPPPAPNDKAISGGPGGENGDKPMKDGPDEPVWLLRDNGKRCFAAPCPSWTATDVKTRAEQEVTGVDVGGLKLAGKDEQAARERILSGQAWARGDIKKVEKAGPGGDGHVLFVSEMLDAKDPVDSK